MVDDASGNGYLAETLDKSNVSEQSIVEIDLRCTTTLDELAQRVDTFCRKVEDRSLNAGIVIIRPDHCSTKPWPGAIEIQHASRWERAVRRLERLPAIIITAASGVCSGPATDFLLISDYRVGAGDFCLELPVNFGQFWPGMSVYRMVHQVGIARARQIVLWGRNLKAEQCLEVGLIDEIVLDLADALADLLRKIERQPASEVGIRRRLLLEAMSTPFEDALGAHLAAADRELRRLNSAFRQSEIAEHEPLR